MSEKIAIIALTLIVVFSLISIVRKMTGFIFRLLSIAVLIVIVLLGIKAWLPETYNSLISVTTKITSANSIGTPKFISDISPYVAGIKSDVISLSENSADREKSKQLIKDIADKTSLIASTTASSEESKEIQSAMVTSLNSLQKQLEDNFNSNNSEDFNSTLESIKSVIK